MVAASAYMLVFRILHILGGIAWGGAIFIMVGAIILIVLGFGVLFPLIFDSADARLHSNRGQARSS